MIQRTRENILPDFNSTFNRFWSHEFRGMKFHTNRTRFDFHSPLLPPPNFLLQKQSPWKSPFSPLLYDRKQTKRKQDWNKRKWRCPHGGEQGERWVNWSRLSRFDSAGELHRVPDDEINSIAKSAGLPEVGRKVHGGNPGHGGTMMMSIVGLPLGKWKHRRHSSLSLSIYLSIYLSFSFSLCCKLHGYTKPRGYASTARSFSRGEKYARGSVMHPNKMNVTIENRNRRFFFSSRLFFGFFLRFRESYGERLKYNIVFNIVEENWIVKLEEFE